MRGKYVRKIILVLLALIVSLFEILQALACDVYVLQCGNLLEDELSANSPANYYVIDLQAQDTLQLQSYPLTPGTGVLPVIEVLDSSGNLIAQSTRSSYDSALLENTLIPFADRYTIKVTSEDKPGHLNLLVLCIINGEFKDANTVPVSGEIAELSDDICVPDTQEPTAEPTLSDVPGGITLVLPDVSKAPPIPMIAGTPMTGAISQGGNEIFAYALDSGESQAVDLSFTRLSGNLNLGVIVMSSNKDIVFLGTLITSGTEQPTLNAHFALPEAGTYTINIITIDLLPPASPEASAFQVTATLGE